MLLGWTHDMDLMTNVCLPLLPWEFLDFVKASKTLCNSRWCTPYLYSKGRTHWQGGWKWGNIECNSSFARFVPPRLRVELLKRASSRSGQQVLFFRCSLRCCVNSAFRLYSFTLLYVVFLYLTYERVMTSLPSSLSSKGPSEITSTADPIMIEKLNPNILFFKLFNEFCALLSQTKSIPSF